MSKKETINLIDTFSEFKELKSIDKTTLMNVVEESFRSVIAKMFGSDENFDVIVNPDKGDFEIYRNRKIVRDEEFEDENAEIKFSDAKKIDEDCEIGEDITDVVDFLGFGRRAILNLRQTLQSKILELHKGNVYTKYSQKVGEIVVAELYQIWKKKCSYLMKMEMNYICQSQNRFLPIFIEKEIWYVQLCRM